MSCCNNLTEQELLEAIRVGDVAIFDRLQQLLTAIEASGGGGGGGGGCVSGFFFNKAVSATVAIAAPFPFDTDGPTNPALYAHTASPTPATSAPITILTAGTYRVDFSVTVAEARQIALYINGAVVPSTIYGQATGTSVTTAFAVITVAANSILTLRNHLSAAALTLVTPSGGTALNDTNSLIITKLC